MLKLYTCTLLFSFLLCTGSYAQQAPAKKGDASEAEVKQLVQKNLTALGLKADEARTLRVASAYYDKHAGGALMAYLQQTYKGIDVYNAISVVAFKNGLVSSAQVGSVPGIDKLVKGRTAVPALSPAEALRKAASEVNEPLSDDVLRAVRKISNLQEYEFLRSNMGNIQVKLLWVPATEDARNYVLSWQVSLQTDKENILWLIKVDAASGQVIDKQNLTVSCNFTSPVHVHLMECYTAPTPAVDDHTTGADAVEAVNSAKFKVIPYPNQDPNFSAPVLVTNPWTIFADADAYTYKWNTDAIRDYDSTRGNNVYAQPDLDNKNNTYKNAAKSSTALPNLTFNFTPDFNKDPLNSTPNRNFGVTNLFYWNNLMHDMTYQYGFDEAAGNFQQTNLGRGGSGNDHVIADAQDAGGTNNANMSTPADGSSPRMQMYLWSASPFKTMKVNQPTAFAGFKMASESSFSANNKLKNTGPITGNVVLYNDAGDPAMHLGCTTSSNAGALSGKIALIDRGTCDFVTKAKNAQNAGAIAVIIADNVEDSAPILMGGTDNSITIPAVSILKLTADSMKSYLSAQVAINITLQPGPQLDGDLDNGIIAHEYTHGISNRLTGGRNNTSCLTNREPRGMGEGWSDFFALMVTTNWATATPTDGFTIPRPIGNYASGLTPEYGGIRYYPYSTDFNVNPWTYDSLAKSSRITNWSALAPAPHTVGEVWCAMLWTLTWDLIASQDINTTLSNATLPGGNTLALQLVTQGMKLQPCNPGFVDARNGILDADSLLFGGAYSNIIWKAFARRGLGYSAKQNKTNNVKDGVAAYNLPPGVSRTSVASFKASRQNTTALLSWTTTGSKANEGRYIVERRANGQDFTPIGTVEATGSHGFTFTDSQPAAGDNTYRIRRQGAGESQLSAERTVQFAGAQALTIAPNPVRNFLTISIPGNSKPIKALLYNMAGGLVSTYAFTGATRTIDVRSLAAGTYYLHLSGSNINYREKIIVQ